MRRGKVWLVGAGPGNPDLLTVRAARILSRARVVAYDELVSPEILTLAPKRAEKIPVGRRANGCRHHEGRIHPLVTARALEGRDVVRLKGGDPLVFGRGGEEIEELALAGIPFEIVPGITAALAACASAGVALTHRDCASSVTFATAHHATTAHPGTSIYYMGLGSLEKTLAELDPKTPAMVISRATLPDEQIITGTAADLAEKVRAADVPAPALLVVGEVVARRTISVKDAPLLQEVG